MAPIDVKLGARVVTADAQQLGKVKEVREDEFLVDARLAPDYWLGTDIVERVSDEEVRLLITKEGVPAAKLPDIKSIDDSNLPSRQ